MVRDLVAEIDNVVLEGGIRAEVFVVAIGTAARGIVVHVLVQLTGQRVRARNTFTRTAIYHQINFSFQFVNIVYPQ